MATVLADTAIAAANDDSHVNVYAQLTDGTITERMYRNGKWKTSTKNPAESGKAKLFTPLAASIEATDDDDATEVRPPTYPLLQVLSLRASKSDITSGMYISSTTITKFAKSTGKAGAGQLVNSIHLPLKLPTSPSSRVIHLHCTTRIPPARSDMPPRHEWELDDERYRHDEHGSPSRH